MKKIWVHLILCLFLSFYGSTGFASTIALELEDLGFHPYSSEDTVSWNDTEQTIEFTESVTLGAIYYLNFIYEVPDNAGTLSFDWEVVLGTDDLDDYLTFEAFDQYSNEIIYAEFPAEPGDDLSGSSPDIDLSPYQGTKISLAWGFIEGDIHGYDDNGNLIDQVNNDSTATISNIELSAADASPVPEPSTLIMLGAGLLFLTGYGKKRI